MTFVHVTFEATETGTRRRARPEGAASRTLVRWARRWLARRGIDPDPNRPPTIAYAQPGDYFIRDLVAWRVEVWGRVTREETT